MSLSGIVISESKSRRTCIALYRILKRSKTTNDGLRQNKFLGTTPQIQIAKAITLLVMEPDGFTKCIIVSVDLGTQLCC